MKKLILLIGIFIYGLSYSQNVTTVRKPTLKVFTGNYDSKTNTGMTGMKLELRQVKSIITGTLNYHDNDKKTTVDLKISGYVQNDKAHIQMSGKSGNVGSAVISLEGEVLTFSINGNIDSLPRKIDLLRI